MPDSATPVTLLILEDQPIIQARLHSLFTAENRFTLLKICGSAEEALAELLVQTPQIFLVDLELPGMSGEELIPLVRAKYPDIKIVVFTVFEDQARTRNRRQGRLPPLRSGLAAAVDNAAREAQCLILPRR